MATAPFPPRQAWHGMRFGPLVGAAAATMALSPIGVGPVIVERSRLTIDALIDIKHPSDAVWSPDGRHAAFLWERAGTQNVWVVDFMGRQPQQARQITQ